MTVPRLGIARIPRWVRGSIQRQFSVIAAALVIVTSALFLIVVSQQYKSSILKAHGTASLNVNLLLQAALENAMIKRDLDGLQGIVERLGAQEHVAGVMIANPQGEIRFSSYPDRVSETLTDADFDRAVTTLTRQIGFRTDPSGIEVLRSINPVSNQPRCTGCHGDVSENPVNGLLVVDYDASGTRAEVRQGAMFLAIFGALVLILLEVGLWIALHRLVLRRLGKMSETTHALASGDLSVRVRPEGQDELSQLGRYFDDMADQLEANVNEIQAAHTSLQALIDAIPDGVRVIGPDFRILMANKAYAAQIGAEMGEVIGSFCHESSHRRDTPCVPTLVCCPVVDILQLGQDNLTCSHAHVDGEGAELSVEVSAAAVMLKINGEMTRCVVESVRDLDGDVSISHKQRLAEMGSLAAGIAHEVHNPLSSISLALKFLQSNAELSDEMLEYMNIAETEIRNCEAITESLLRLSALPRVENELVDMTAAIRGTVSLLNFEAETSGVQIETDVQNGLHVLSRDSDMRNLVFNLAINAIHAMPDGGVLKIRCHQADGELGLEVEDNGVGIPERDQAKILMPFWTRRADGSKGRGLGLAICASIVKNLNGSLSFTSQVGAGTCFKVVLPITDDGLK